MREAHGIGRRDLKIKTYVVTLGFEDFSLYRLRLGQGRFVAGFARAYDVGPDAFGDLAAMRRGIRSGS